MLRAKMKSAVSEVCEYFWQQILEASPELGTYIGQDVLPTGMDTYTERTYQQKTELSEEILRRLDAIPSDTNLTDEDKLNIAILSRYANVCIEGVNMRHFLIAVSHGAGPDYYFLRYTMDRMPFDQPLHYQNYCQRLALFPKQVLEIQGLLAKGITEGIMPHESSVAPVLGTLEAVFSCAPEDTEFYKPFQTIPQDFCPELRKRLTVEGRDMIQKCVQDSLKQLHHFLHKEYIPHCRPEFSINSLPPSPSSAISRYDAVLRFHCDTQLSAREIHEQGLKRVKKLQQDIHILMNEVGFHGSIQEFSRHLSSKEDQFFKTNEELFDYCDNLLTTRIRPALGRLFHSFPSLPLRIMASDGAQLALGIYNAPSAGAGQEGQLWMSPRALKMPKYQLLTLILHETEPGHHYQACHMMAREDLPDFRRLKDDRKSFEIPARFPQNTAHTEGWGLYAEELGMELGLFEDPYERFGFLDQNIKRAMRMVIDPAIHTLGWSRDQALKFMMAHTPITEEAANKELDRYIIRPGQACAYTYGLLRVRALREMAEEQLGDLFDIRDFHSACLRHGQLPLDILEDVVKMYIKETLAKSAS